MNKHPKDTWVNKWMCQQWIRNWSRKGQTIDWVHNALKLLWPHSRQNFLKQTPCIPTNDSDTVAWEKKGGSRGRGLLLNRMQLNSYYKLLPISCLACYSCKGQCYWEGCTKLQEGKADCLLSEGMMGDEYILLPGVHFSVLVENSKVC